ncbi:hypothetical protein GE21DRAFT_1223162, partial [Neurospora crassa]
DINYNTEYITFSNISLLVIPFNVQRYSIKYVRKVTVLKKTVLQPGEETIVTVYYKPLPKGRNFIFNSSNNSIINIIVNYKSLKLILFKNSIRGVRIILKK